MFQFLTHILNLKQNISINFQGLDFKYAMDLMAEIGDINILVGEEVSGTSHSKN
jgi:type IV pilus assembly protein PilQ